MADQNTPTGGAPAAPVTPLPPPPAVAERLTVPASALGLETELPQHLQIPARPDDFPAPAAPTGPAATAPAATPAAPATGPSGPAATAPASTAPAVTATAPTGPAPENKVKIGEKEYTTQELEKILADRAQQNNQPQAPAATAPAAPVPPTPEQIAEHNARVAAAETQWSQNFVKEHNPTFATTEAELETLLGGGKEAVDVFSKKLQDVAVKAVLLARKTIYADLNPQMADFARRIEPLFQNQAQLERHAVEQAFLRQYPEYQGQHMETARQVAEALQERYPAQVQRMSPQQFIQTVNDQCDKILQAEYKKYFPNATDSWRDAAKRNAAPAAPAPAPAATVTPAPAATPATAPAAPSPWNQAPAANSPASIPAVPAADWNKSVAQSLRD